MQDGLGSHTTVRLDCMGYDVVRNKRQHESWIENEFQKISNENKEREKELMIITQKVDILKSNFEELKEKYSAYEKLNRKLESIQEKISEEDNVLKDDDMDTFVCVVWNNGINLL